MYIADKQFNVLEKVKAFNRKGHYSKDAIKLMKKYSIVEGANMRTELDIENLKKCIILSASLVEKYNNRIKQQYH